MYVTVVSLSKENDKKLLEQLISGFKRTVKWNKYSSQMTIQPQNINLNYLFDPVFTEVNRLFVLSLARMHAGQQCFLSSKNQKKLRLNFYKILPTSFKNRNSKYCKFIKQS